MLVETLRLVFIILGNAGQFVSYMFWAAVLWPVKLLHADLYWTLEGHMIRLCHAMVGSWLWLAGFTVAETGDDIHRYQGDGCLFLVNHQSLADVPFLMYGSLSKPEASTWVHWALAHKFRFSHFGLICLARNDMFVKTDRAKHLRQQDNIELQTSLLQTAQSNPHKKWIFLFPEGGLLHKKREKSQQYAKAHGFPVLQHVSLPRAGAVSNILKAIGPQTTGTHRKVEWIVDLTIIYPDGVPSALTDLVKFTSKDKRVLFHYKVHSASALPSGEKELTSWLHRDFQRRDVMLGNLYNQNKQRDAGGGGDGRGDVTPMFGDLFCDVTKAKPADIGLTILASPYLFVAITLYILWRLLLCVYSS